MDTLWDRLGYPARCSPARILFILFILSMQSLPSATHELVPRVTACRMPAAI